MNTEPSPSPTRLTAPSFVRLIEAANNISQEQLSIILDESTQTISNWKKRGVSKDGAIKASEKFNVSTLWILKGISPEASDALNNEFLPSDSKNLEVEFDVPLYVDFSFNFEDGESPQITGLVSRKLKISKQTLVKYSVSAYSVCALTSKDDSMKSVINNEAQVFVDLGRKHISNGKIFAIYHGGIFTFSYLYQMPKGGVRIVSENKNEYPEVILSAEEILEQDFFIIGYAFNVLNSLP